MKRTLDAIFAMIISMRKFLGFLLLALLSIKAMNILANMIVISDNLVFNFDGYYSKYSTSNDLLERFAANNNFYNLRWVCALLVILVICLGIFATVASVKALIETREVKKVKRFFKRLKRAAIYAIQEEQKSRS